MKKQGKYCVYCHITPSKRRYVGISLNHKKRWNSGRGYAKNYLFNRAIRKYGWDNIEHVVLYTGLSIEEAQIIEKELIEKWHLTDPRYGYNLREGGDGAHSEHSRELMSKSRMGNKNSAGRVLSDDTRAKIAQSLREYYKDHTPTFSGRHHSEATIAKLKARTFSDETRAKMRKSHASVAGANNPSARPVRQLSLTGELICEYDYAKLAAKKFNIDLSAIIKCCKGKQKTCGGYRWEYK